MRMIDADKYKQILERWVKEAGEAPYEEARIEGRAIYDCICQLEEATTINPEDLYGGRRVLLLDDVYTVIAGHSDYHGDNILAALTCIAEGKEVKAIKPLEDLRPKWISVEERLPEPETEEVLILLENGDMFNVTYESEIDGCKFGTYRPCFDPHTLGFTDSEWIEIEGVTHWMPLPEPPCGAKMEG